MKKRKRKRPTLLPLSAAERHMQPITEVLLDESSDTSSIEDAYEDLLRMEGRYVLPPEYYSSRMVAASALNRSQAEILNIAEEGVEKYPEDVFLRFNLGAAFFQYGYPLLAYRELESAKVRHTRKDAAFLQMEQIDDLLHDIELEAPELISTVGLEWPADRDVALAGEEVRRAMELRDFDRCVTLSLDLLEERPDQNHVRNNLARALWEQGRISDAISHQEESLQRDPDRLSGLANMVRFCSITNRRDQAQKWADHALSLERPFGPALFPLLEILAFIGEDSEISTIAEEVESSFGTWPEGPRGTAALFFGASFARAGRPAEALRWWKTAESSGFSPAAQAHREELNRPETDRNSPWYFTASDLLPQEIAGTLRELKVPEESDDLVAWIRPVLEAFPEFAQCGHYLLRDGDDAARFFGLAILESTQDPEMAQEATKLIRNDIARKDRRAQAFRTLESYGPVEMPELGDTLHVQGYAITFDPVSKFPEDIQKMYETAHKHLTDGEPEQAEKVLLQALAMYDDPSIRQNLAVAYQNQDKREEAKGLLSETRMKYPDYAFARCADATRLAGQGKFAEAHSLVEPVIQRNTLHVSEYTALCEAMCSILVQEEKLDEAATWLEMWREVVPDDQRQEKFVLLEGYRAMNTMLDKIGKKGKSGKR
jgi:tetratricopeptide (TPR) repeat protein